MATQEPLYWDGKSDKPVPIDSIAPSKSGGSTYFRFVRPIRYRDPKSQTESEYSRAQLLNRYNPDVARSRSLDPNTVSIHLEPGLRVENKELQIFAKHILHRETLDQLLPVTSRKSEPDEPKAAEALLQQAREEAEAIRAETTSLAYQLREDAEKKRREAKSALDQAKEKEELAEGLRQQAEIELEEARKQAHAVIAEARAQAQKETTEAARDRIRGQQRIELLEKHLYQQINGDDPSTQDRLLEEADSSGIVVETSLDQVISEARRCGSHQDTEVIERSALAFVLSSVTGQMPVFAGPPGSGKTTLAMWMSRFMGYRPEKISVRPGWIDSTDLLGYYHPSLRTFIPTVFTEAVMKSLSLSNNGVAILLDEMNIARVENYAADLLTQLEKAHESLNLPYIELYSSYMSTANGQRDPISEAHTKETSHSVVHRLLKLPRTLMIVGTINHDRTTFELSPKVLDRSLIVKVPHKVNFDLTASMTDPTSTAGSVHSIQQALADRAADVIGRAQNLWKSTSEISGPNTGIHVFLPSQRTAQIIRFLPASADLLGISDTKALDHLLCMKALPLINGFKTQIGHSPADLEGASVAAREMGFGMLESALTQLAGSADETVSYLQ